MSYITPKILCVFALAIGVAHAQEQVVRDGHLAGQQFNSQMGSGANTPTLDAEGNWRFPQGANPDIVIDWRDLGGGPDNTRTIEQQMGPLQDLNANELSREAERRRQSLQTQDDLTGDAVRAVERLDEARLPNIARDEQQLLRGARDATQGRLVGALADAYVNCRMVEETVRDGARSYDATHHRQCLRLAVREDGCTRARDLSVQAELGERYEPYSMNQDRFVTVDVRDIVASITPTWAELRVEFVRTEPPSPEPWTVTIRDQPSAGNDWQGQFLIEYDDRNCPIGPCPFVDVLIRIEAQVVGITGDGYVDNPTNCLSASDGFCQAQWACVDNQPRTIGGVLIDDRFAGLFSPLFPGDPNSPVCWSAAATYQCPFPNGTVCNNNGTQCHTVTDSNVVLDNCAVLDAEERRTGNIGRIIRTECQANARGADNFCYVETQTRSYSTIHAVPTYRTTRRVECAGPLRCAGNDCVVRQHGEGENSANLLDNELRLAMMNHLSFDTAECTGDRCNVLAAVPLYCRQQTGGPMTTCVIERDAQRAADYYRGYSAQSKRQAARRGLTQSDDIGDAQPGAQTTLRPDTASVAGTLYRPLASGQETLRGGGADPLAAPPASGVWQDALGQTDALVELPVAYIEKVRQEDLSGSALGADETALARLRGFGNCLHVGGMCVAGEQACTESWQAYCCYATPLSKSMAEYMGADLGTADDPQCMRGVPLEQAMALVNDTRFQATDWLAMRAYARQYPTAETAAGLLNAEETTGRGNELSRTTDGRINAVARATRMTQGVDTVGVVERLSNEVEAMAPAPIGDDRGIGEIRLVQSAMFATTAQEAITVAVRRSGGSGPARAILQVYGPGNAQGAAIEVAWAAGERGDKSVVVPNWFGGQSTGGTFTVVLENGQPAPEVLVEPVRASIEVRHTP